MLQYKCIFIFLIIFLNLNAVATQLEEVKPESVGISSNRLQIISNVYKEAILNKKFWCSNSDS